MFDSSHTTHTLTLYLWVFTLSSIPVLSHPYPLSYTVVHYCPLLYSLFRPWNVGTPTPSTMGNCNSSHISIPLMSSFIYYINWLPLQGLTQSSSHKSIPVKSLYRPLGPLTQKTRRALETGRSPMHRVDPSAHWPRPHWNRPFPWHTHKHITIFTFHCGRRNRTICLVNNPMRFSFLLRFQQYWVHDLKCIGCQDPGVASYLFT